MCGICGIYGLEDKKILKKMMSVISHRGPDGDGQHLGKNVSLGHTRLSIIDLKKGDQPIYNEDKSVSIVYNGELYNYKVLREDLKKLGHKFRTNSDTEVIVHAYEAYGEYFANKLNGMFAFAINDSKKKRIILVRDRAGIKPLFYSLQDGLLLFGSEIKSILQYDGFVKKLDFEGLSSFLTFGSILGDKTLISGIKQLLPGQQLTYDGKKMKLFSFVKKIKRPLFTDERKTALDLKQTLEKAIESQLISDVPLGAFLSGGIDSSTIVGVMSRVLDSPVETFTVGFGRDDDELNYAKKVAEHFGTNHHELIVRPKDVIPAVTKLAWHYDNPIWDAASVPTYFVSVLARKHVKVVLTGEGADELFAGYNRYKPLSPSFFFVPRVAKIYFYNKFARLFNEKIRFHVAGVRSSYSDYIEQRYLKNPKLLDGVLQFERNELLPNQLLNKVDRATMAASLEARVPFLDNTLLDFADRTPLHMKMRGLTGKYILRKAVSKIIPREIITRGKRGFGASALQWLGYKDFEGAMEGVLDDPHITKEGLDYTVSKKLMQTKGIRKQKQAYGAWSLFMLELWYRTFIEGNGDKAIKL